MRPLQPLLELIYVGGGIAAPWEVDAGLRAPQGVAKHGEDARREAFRGADITAHDIMA